MNGSKWNWPLEHPSYAHAKADSDKLDDARKIRAAKEFSAVESEEEQNCIKKNEIFWSLWFGLKAKALRECIRSASIVYSSDAFKEDFDSILEFDDRKRAADALIASRKKKPVSAKSVSAAAAAAASAKAEAMKPPANFTSAYPIYYADYKSYMQEMFAHVKKEATLLRTRNRKYQEMLHSPFAWYSYKKMLEAKPGNELDALLATGFSPPLAPEIIGLAEFVKSRPAVEEEKNVFWTCELFEKMFASVFSWCSDVFRKHAEIRASENDVSPLVVGEVVDDGMRAMKSMVPTRFYSDPLWKAMNSALRLVITMTRFNNDPSAIPPFAPLFLSNRESGIAVRALYIEKKPGADFLVLNLDAMNSYGSFERLPDGARFDANWGRTALKLFSDVSRPHSGVVTGVFPDYSRAFGCYYGHDPRMNVEVVEKTARFLCSQYTVDEVRAALWAHLHHTGVIDFQSAMPFMTLFQDREFIVWVRDEVLCAEKSSTRPARFLVDISRIRPIQNHINIMMAANVWCPPQMPWVYLSSIQRVMALAKSRYYLSFDSRNISYSKTRWNEKNNACGLYNRHRSVYPHITDSGEYQPDFLNDNQVDCAGRTVIDLIMLIEACANESHRERFEKEPWVIVKERKNTPENPFLVPYHYFLGATNRPTLRLHRDMDCIDGIPSKDESTLIEVMKANMKNNSETYGVSEHGGNRLHSDVGVDVLKENPHLYEYEDARMNMAFLCEGVSYYDPLYCAHSPIKSQVKLYAACIVQTVFGFGSVFCQKFNVPTSKALFSNIPRLINQHRESPTGECEDGLVFQKAARLAYFQMVGDVQSLHAENVCPICLVDFAEDGCDEKLGTFLSCQRCFLRGQFNRRVGNVYHSTALHMERISAWCANYDRIGVSCEDWFTYEPAHIHAIMLKVCAQRGLMRCDLAHQYRDESEYSPCSFVHCALVEMEPNEIHLRYVDTGDDELANFKGTAQDKVRNWWSVQSTPAFPPQMVLLHSADPERYIAKHIDHNRVACLHHAMRERRHAAEREHRGMPTAAQRFAAAVVLE